MNKRKLPKPNKALMKKRKDASLTQYELGFLSGISQTYIWKIETNLVNPSDEIKDRVATALNCSVSEIWSE